MVEGGHPEKNYAMVIDGYPEKFMTHSLMAVKKKKDDTVVGGHPEKNYDMVVGGYPEKFTTQS